MIDAAHSCAEPEYPPAAKRLMETGTTTLKFLIGVDGRVTDSLIEESSGYARLDEAARDALKLCHFQPGKVNGRPEPAWAKLKYKWTLR